jgi:hypothetical protein
VPDSRRLSRRMAGLMLAEGLLVADDNLMCEMHGKEADRQDRRWVNGSAMGMVDELFRTTYLQAVDGQRCYSESTLTLYPCRMYSHAIVPHSPKVSRVAEAGLGTVAMTYRSCRSGR